MIAWLLFTPGNQIPVPDQAVQRAANKCHFSAVVRATPVHRQWYQLPHLSHSIHVSRWYLSAWHILVAPKQATCMQKFSAASSRWNFFPLWAVCLEWVPANWWGIYHSIVKMGEDLCRLQLVLYRMYSYGKNLNAASFERTLLGIFCVALGNKVVHGFRGWCFSPHDMQNWQAILLFTWTWV